MEHVQADAVVLHEFLVGAFADPGKLDDVARFVTSPLEEPPKLRVADHGQRLPNAKSDLLCSSITSRRSWGEQESIWKIYTCFRNTEEKVSAKQF